MRTHENTKPGHPVPHVNRAGTVTLERRRKESSTRVREGSTEPDAEA